MFRKRYKEGLLIGDIISCKLNGAENGYLNSDHNFLIVDKEFLFAQETRYGKRTFWKYMGFDINSNKVKRFRTQDMKVKKIISYLKV